MISDTRSVETRPPSALNADRSGAPIRYAMWAVLSVALVVIAILAST